MKQNLSKICAASALALVCLPLCGCQNVGNDNPITPEMMEKGRQQENDARANFSPPPGTGQK
jgi:hypothetical protein